MMLPGLWFVTFSFLPPSTDGCLVFPSFFIDPLCFRVVIHRSYEQAHFTVALSGKTSLWWIGLRAKGGTGGGVEYIWENGSPLTFTHWDRNQPGNGQETEAAAGRVLEQPPPLCLQITGMVPAWP